LAESVQEYQHGDHNFRRQRIAQVCAAWQQEGRGGEGKSRGALELKDLLTHCVKRRGANGSWEDAALVDSCLQVVSACFSKEGAPSGEQLTTYVLVKPESAGHSDDILHASRSAAAANQRKPYAYVHLFSKMHTYFSAIDFFSA
jgi:hypothetical protein